MRLAPFLRSLGMTALLAAAFGNIDVLPGTAIDITGTTAITCNTDPNIIIHTCLSINAGSANDANAQNFTVFGRMPSQSAPIPGACADTIVTTVTF